MEQRDNYLTQNDSVLCAVATEKREAGVRKSFPKEATFEGIQWGKKGKYILIEE